MTWDLQRGATWSKWDLHVHTPASLHQRYGDASDTAVWDRFIDELESLPPEFKVVGINDYWFLDGYKRVLEYRARGRLGNLDAIFPVLELRLDQFAGTTGHLQKANLHVIFDPTIGADVIESQFIASLATAFSLTPQSGAGATWSGIPDRSSLADLGKAIKETVPESERSRFESDLKEGFNNLVISLESVQETLARPYFQNRAVLALGKTEWADIAWHDGSIASKKNLVCSVRLLFTAFDNPNDWTRQREKLACDEVLTNSIDCSDAHTWSDNTADKDRIGNSNAWVRASPTFSGFLHALSEFESWVFVGVEPSDLRRIRSMPERIIDSVSVGSAPGTNGELFGYTVRLNPGLVAVIGNKGQGKSALLDCVGRAGNSSRENVLLSSRDVGFSIQEMTTQTIS